MRGTWGHKARSCSLLTSVPRRLRTAATHLGILPRLRPGLAPARTFRPGVPPRAAPATTKPRARALLALIALPYTPYSQGPAARQEPGSTEPEPTWQLCRLAPAQPGAPRGPLDSSAPDRGLPPGRSQGRGRCARTRYTPAARGGGKSAGAEPSRPGRRGRGRCDGGGGVKMRPHWACPERTGRWEIDRRPSLPD